MTFGEKLKEARKESGLSQEQLAEKMDFITTNELANRVDSNKFVVGKYKFTKGYQIL